MHWGHVLHARTVDKNVHFAQLRSSLVNQLINAVGISQVSGRGEDIDAVGSQRLGLVLRAKQRSGDTAVPIYLLSGVLGYNSTD